ncbi:hypothetical protein SUGI_1193330 [Cryptomeria japonica]|nr:hypothetical protein SUGI_1193330 [Cryptomeria japonica]
MENNASKDLLSGTVGGVAQLICGHPFDTIKVKLQSQPVPPPGQPPRYAGAMVLSDRQLQQRALEMETLVRTAPGIPLSVEKQVVCGAGVGVAVSMLACPTELVKCRLQAQSALATGEAAAVATAGTTTGASSTAVAPSIKYNGPISVAKHVLKSEGGILGLFKGLTPTLAREVPGNAVMFGVYEALKQYLAGGRDTSRLSQGALLTSGGLAGAAFWLAVYPTDVVKSVIQVDNYHQPKYSGSIDAFKKIVASEGIKGLYKGFGPAMARSVPANAACFLAYEITRSSLG